MPVAEKSSTRVHFLQYSCQFLEVDLPLMAPPERLLPCKQKPAILLSGSMVGLQATPVAQ